MTDQPLKKRSWNTRTIIPSLCTILLISCAVWLIYDISNGVNRPIALFWLIFMMFATVQSWLTWTKKENELTGHNPYNYENKPE